MYTLHPSQAAKVVADMAIDQQVKLVSNLRTRKPSSVTCMSRRDLDPSLFAFLQK
jgi:hypothetical protein